MPAVFWTWAARSLSVASAASPRIFDLVRRGAGEFRQIHIRPGDSLQGLPLILLVHHVAAPDADLGVAGDFQVSIGASLAVAHLVAVELGHAEIGPRLFRGLLDEPLEEFLGLIRVAGGRVEPA